MKHSTGLLQFQGFRKWHLGSILTMKKWVFYRYFFRKRQLFRGKTVEYLTFTEESLYFMQQLITLCYCKSFWRNSSPKVHFEKQTKSNLFIRTSKHTANASPPNQNRVLEFTFIIFSINLAMQTNWCLYRQCVILKHLLQLVLPTFI